MTANEETAQTVSEETPQKLSRFEKITVAFMAVFAVTMLALVVIYYMNYRQYQLELEKSQRQTLSFEQAQARLQELADKGCQAPFNSFGCREPYSVQWSIFEAMDREKIEFGTRGVTQDKLDELYARAEVRIASQKLAYLKANGGVKLPSDLHLLSDVCEEVYIEKRFLLGGNPTDAELKQLLPPGVTNADSCRWSGWDKI